MMMSNRRRPFCDVRLARMSSFVFLVVLLIQVIPSTQSVFHRSSNASGLNGWNSEQCSQSSDRCTALGQTQCLDLVLPYRSALPGGVWNVSGHPSVPWTNVGLLSTSNAGLWPVPDQADVLSYVNLWSGLRSVPRCWAALQTLMCTTLMPRCEGGRVQTPSIDLCRTVRTQCKVIDVYMRHRSLQSLPPWLNCNQSQVFRPRCRNEHQDLRVNASAARCVAPLVPTENSKSWFPNVDGCALQCNAYENANSDRFRLVLISGTLIAFACNAIALAGLAIGWRSLRRPSHFLAHINGCHVLHSLGWVVQLMAGRSHLVCRPDGTARFDEPAAGPACVLSLILLYFSSAAIVFWYIALAYAWGIVFGRRVGARQYLCQHTRHLHLATYGGAFALTVAALAFAHVDGSWNLGVCFITVQSGWARIFLLAVPLTISLLAVLALMCRNLRLLYIARKSERRPEKSFLIAQMMRRIGICIAVVTFLFFSLFAIGALKAQDQKLWEQHFSDKLLCSLNLTQALTPGQTDETECPVQEAPTFLTDYWIAVIVFGSGLLSSGWTLNRATLQTWRRWLLLRLLDDSQLRMQPTVALKNELIARSYKNREQPVGREYTPSLQSLHDDPVRMDLGSATPERLSTSFINQLPNLLSRRGAVFKDTFKDSHLLHTYPLHVHKLLGNVSGNPLELKHLPGMINGNELQMGGSFVSIGNWSDASQQLHASIDSLANHSLDSNQPGLTVNLPVHPPRRKTRRERNAESMHKNFKARHARLLATMNRRRGSDTSSVGSMMVNTTGKQVPSSQVTCKATSTGDLQKPNTSQGPVLQTSNVMSAQLFPNPMISQTPSNLPYLPPSMYSAYSTMVQGNQAPLRMPIPGVPIVAASNAPHSVLRRPMPEMGNSAYAFMHGMSEQDSRTSLANPFNVKRSADNVPSSTSITFPTNVAASTGIAPRPPSGSIASAFHCDGSNMQIQSAVGMGHFSPMHMAPSTVLNPMMAANHVPYGNMPMLGSMPHYPYSPPHVASHPANPYAAMCTHPPMPPHPAALPFPAYMNGLPMPGQMYPPPMPYPTAFNPNASNVMAVRADQMFKHRTLQDLQQDMRGRQEIGHICKGVDSASETNDPMFPIQLSDLEGFMTDASGRRTHLSRTSNSAQRIVRARIQQVQDDQQTNDPTSDILLPLDMHDQPTDPIDSTANDPKSESTKKKNKKKSSKKKFLK